MNRGDKLPPINFKALAEALLAMAETLVPMWLPGGAKVPGSAEYACASLSGGKGSSCSVNLKKGVWKDFATDETGPDLISLYAAIHGLDQGKAAVQVARDYGLEDVAGVQRDAQHKPATPPPPPPSKKAPASDEGWRTMMPVPQGAPEATFKHQYRLPADIEHTAAYRKDGHLLGYVVRFRTSDGGKETLPYTWCTSARDGASRWHWKQWDEPRPLYFPGGVSPGGLYEAGQPPRTVVLVEGEKKAEALQALLDAGSPGVYLVASWPGGCKAWKKALWEWLAGCTVLLWPDCDAKRVPLTKKEREACLDDTARETVQAMKPLLPEHQQPGMAAMLAIGALLRDTQVCKVQLLPIPKPGDVADGWDCGDAINTDGWDHARVLKFFGQAQPLPADAAAPEAKAAGGGGGGGGKNRDRLVATGDGDDAFRDYLNFLCDQFKCEPHEISVNRKVVIMALRKAPALQGCLGLNLLTGAPSTQYPWPWRETAGPLQEGDALRLGDWLSTEYKLKAASKAALEEAIDTVADAHRFHPIRDWLNGLEHDGIRRIDKWLIYVLGKDPETLSPRRCRYLQLVGRFILMGLVARVMQPGCKFDYSLVLEGLTGRGKSTFVKTLVGEDYFSDTHFDIGAGKDGFEQLEGLWGYELSELTALRKADSEQVKGFFSSTADRFRGAYAKYVQKHPRQCVIFCSTNKMRYLYDLTGNRRFWPIWIDQYIKLAWLRKFREQLFAEAVALYREGERYVPTPEEDETYFEPEQRLRLVETAVQSRLYALLTREGASSGEGKLSVEISVNTEFVTLDRLVSALGSDAAKSNAQLENQIRGWLENHGWVYKRSGSAAGGGPRPYGYRRPKVWPPQLKDDDLDGEEEPGRRDDLKKAPDAPGNENGGDDSEPF